MTIPNEGSWQSEEDAESDDYVRRSESYGERDDYGRIRKLRAISEIAAVVVLVLCSAWLIVREGVPAGVAPFCFAAVLFIWICTGHRNAFPFMTTRNGLHTMSLVFGTFFFIVFLPVGELVHCLPGLEKR